MTKQKNPNAKVPEQELNEPLGDRGQGDKTWSPEQDKQGISNRLGDAEEEKTDDEDEDDDFDEDDDSEEDDAEGEEGEEPADKD